MSENVIAGPPLTGEPTPSPAVGSVTQSRTSALAVIALISGILFPLLGIVLGAIGMKHVKRTGMKGYGLAKAGFVVGLSLFIVGLIVGLFGFWFFGGFVATCQTIGVGCPLPLSPSLFLSEIL
ncbi:DUF4190 domain-containing protein [Brevibacterium zhoupengii]|uniref:DUF4190 domain-containing protein n=1 Tax=Brevibacterium zhoupengii TaxID=2898795 RepID=UPI001F08B667|nr:DUF4190 domain-containing protein [Brevibacterium zhoupengii]